MPESRAERILIADDREENRYVLRRVLTAVGYQCTEAETGAKALDAAQAIPDLIILDVRLPDISGFEVCQRLKRDPRTSSIPVLQISASFVSSEDRVRALEGGADGYLTHPIDRMVLVATVRALMRLRRAEAVARTAAEQWESTFNSLAEGLAIIDPAGQLVRCNRAFEDICTPHAVPKPGEGAAEFLDRLLGTHAPLQLEADDRFSGEFTIANKSVHLSSNRIGTPPQRPAADYADPRDTILILSDITDRKLAEYALRTAEKLAATGKLANVIAHEINNPLEALTNLLYLAADSGNMDAIKAFVRSANDELSRISRITRQTLAFHRDTQSPIALDVADLIANVVALYEGSAASKHVRLVYHQQPIPPIAGFPGMLTQVFGNLVRNASEAAPPGSQVTVRLRPIHRKGSPGVLVTIHNGGAGIPQAIREKIFDPFFTTKELKGSGLGLWVSRNLISQHQGTIRFRTSEHGERSGTVFQVYLPVGETPAGAINVA